MNKPLSLALLAARHDLLSFVMLCISIITPSESFQQNWHHELIADALMKVKRGDIKRLVITIPPRHLKTMITTVAFTAWYLGHNPDLRVIIVSYSQELAEKNARDILKILRHPLFQAIFPRAALAKVNVAAHNINTTHGGMIYSTSISGTLTGLGGDLLILDDPMKPDEALSEADRKRIIQSFKNTIRSRLNHPTESAIVLVMQRLHVDDLAANMMALETCEVISLPAIALQDEAFEVETLNGPKTVGRKIGEALHPERFSLEHLNNLKEQIGEYTFASQYQQQPIPLEGGIVKKRWLRTYQSAELPPSFDRVILSVDTATKAGEHNDYSCCIAIGQKGDLLYVLDVFRARLEYADLLKQVLLLIARFHPTKILVEDAASGAPLVSDLKRKGIHQVEPVPVGGRDKTARMTLQTPVIEQGRFLLPAAAHWLEAYVEELTMFPGAKHDDQVDATSQALKWISENDVQPGMLSYMKGEYEELLRIRARKKEEEEQLKRDGMIVRISPWHGPVDDESER